MDTRPEGVQYADYSSDYHRHARWCRPCAMGRDHRSIVFRHSLSWGRSGRLDAEMERRCRAADPTGLTALCRMLSRLTARLAPLCHSAIKAIWYDARRASQRLLPNGVRLSYYRHANPIPKLKGIAMESIISNLLSRFEKGSLSRRELVQGLAMLAASGTAASAQEDINFKAANIDHVSIQVGNLQRSIDFYQKMFGFTVVSQAEEGGVKIVRLGTLRHWYLSM